MANRILNIFHTKNMYIQRRKFVIKSVLTELEKTAQENIFYEGAESDFLFFYLQLENVNFFSSKFF